MLVSNSNVILKMSTSGSHDIVGHVTVRSALQFTVSYIVVSYNHTLVLHGYGDLKTEGFWSYDLDLLGSRDVIGHVTIRLATYGFL